MIDPDGATADARSPDPLLSIVVTIVEGVRALEPFLVAIRDQHDPPPLEILVPHDATVGDIGALAVRFPAVHFLDLGTVATGHPPRSAAGQHELFDRRRAAALAAATGDLVAILEDRGVPRPDWARTAVTLHRHRPAAVIGGAIEPAAGRVVDWALHVCDYSRYSLPFEAGAVDWVSDVNVTYKRRALDATRTLWQDRFHEPLVHWELQRQGEELRLEPSLVVDHRRTPAPLGRILGERFAWGRLWGAIRAREESGVRRAMLVLAAPLIPCVVLSRHARVQFRRGEGLRFLGALPILALLLGTWTAGEAVGLLTRRA